MSVELVKAKTVDAYSIANAEWVIEGYFVPYERVWETEAAENANSQGTEYFHPEWARYMGRAYRNRKFEVTAVTRRKDRPLYSCPFSARPGTQFRSDAPPGWSFSSGWRPDSCWTATSFWG